MNATLRPAKVACAWPERRYRWGDRGIVPNLAVLRWAQIPRDPDGTLATRANHTPDWGLEIRKRSPSRPQLCSGG